MIKVVAFDLDDTLWHVDPVIHRAEQKLTDWLRQQVPGIRYDIGTLRELREVVMAENPNLAYRVTDLRFKVIERALLLSELSPGDAKEMALKAMDLFLAARNEVEFFAGALKMIESISSRYRLGALTNGNADIHRTGLGKHFGFAFSAEQVGAPKPAPDLFQYALAHTGCAPHEMVYVGDDPVKDVDAAKQVGLKTVWLKNDRRPGPFATDPDQVIEDITRLPEALAFLAGQD